MLIAVGYPPNLHFARNNRCIFGGQWQRRTVVRLIPTIQLLELNMSSNLSWPAALVDVRQWLSTVLGSGLTGALSCMFAHLSMTWPQALCIVHMFMLFGLTLLFWMLFRTRMLIASALTDNRTTVPSPWKLPVFWCIGIG